MSDRPIIFSAPMVRALLAGRKTQTRRLATSPLRRCEVGDRLYVREAWRTMAMHDDRKPRWLGEAYRRSAYGAAAECPTLLVADGAQFGRWPDERDVAGWLPGKLRPSLHMPRWASRLTLTVTDVWVQPLQAISEGDAIAEGLSALTKDRKLVKYGIADRDGLPGNDDDGWHWQDWCADPVAAYARLWNHLHRALSEAWHDNPQIVALTFTVENANIDRIGDRG